MLLFVGLGNPGESYRNNRHNVGFMAIDVIAGRYGFDKPKARFQGECQSGSIDGVKILLLKPRTFMNQSGRSVGEAMRYLKIEPENLVVFHDELDISAGKLKMKTGGGASGHNGIKSLIAHIGPEFRRVRIGISHPGHKDDVHDYVLSNFKKSDTDWLEPLLDQIAEDSHWLAKSNDPRFMTAVALEKDDKAETSPEDQT